MELDMFMNFVEKKQLKNGNLLTTSYFENFLETLRNIDTEFYSFFTYLNFGKKSPSRDISKNI